MGYFTTTLNTLHQFGINIVAHIPNIVIAILFTIITYFFAKLCAHIINAPLRRIRMRVTLIQVFQKLLITFIWFIGILIIASILFPSVTAANLLATLGLTSVAIGFAFKSIFENFLAGILILLREPFHIGDFIVCKDQQGYVERISLRNTHIRQTDGSRIAIPNSTIFNNPTQILTDHELRRVESEVCVNFSEDLEKVRKIIKSAIDHSKTIAKDKYVQVYVKSFSSNGINFSIYWWTHSKPGDIRKSRDEVLTNIKKALDAENIELTYSTTLSFQEPLKIKKIKSRKEEKEKKKKKKKI